MCRCHSDVANQFEDLVVDLVLVADGAATSLPEQQDDHQGMGGVQEFGEVHLHLHSIRAVWGDGGHQLPQVEGCGWVTESEVMRIDGHHRTHIDMRVCVCIAQYSSSTLIRVCSSMAPYEIDGLNALKRSCITTCDDETTPIPERRIYKARGIIYASWCKIEYLTNINSHNQMIRDDYKKYYLPLTENQIEVLINSDVMNFVLPITTLLDQRTGK